MLYRFFDMGPDLRLALERRTPRLGDLTALLLEGVDRLVDETQPDVVLVQGDTTSALVGALSGYYNDKPVAHIEAGLRTGTREPFRADGADPGQPFARRHSRRLYLRRRQYGD